MTTRSRKLAFCGAVITVCAALIRICEAPTIMRNGWRDSKRIFDRIFHTAHDETATAQTVTPTANRNTNRETTDFVPGDAGSSQSGFAAASIDTRAKLVVAFDAARRHTYPSERDDAFVRIAERASVIRDFEFACKAACEITFSNRKDECLDRVVDSALNANDTGAANLATESISFPTTKDRARQRIASLESVGNR